MTVRDGPISAAIHPAARKRAGQPGTSRVFVTRVLPLALQMSHAAPCPGLLDVCWFLGCLAEGERVGVGWVKGVGCVGYLRFPLVNGFGAEDVWKTSTVFLAKGAEEYHLAKRFGSMSMHRWAYGLSPAAYSTMMDVVVGISKHVRICGRSPFPIPPLPKTSCSRRVG